jgi:hypothetical protein
MTQPAKHTPGPWIVDGVYIIRGPKRCVVAKLIDSKEPYETKVANGHMLAAAPAMYEALMSIVGLLDGRHAEIVSTALAQAEGRTL